MTNYFQLLFFQILTLLILVNRILFFVNKLYFSKPQTKKLQKGKNGNGLYCFNFSLIYLKQNIRINKKYIFKIIVSNHSNGTNIIYNDEAFPFHQRKITFRLPAAFPIIFK